MGAITLKQAAGWCGGKVEARYENIAFCGANNDTRHLQPGELFVALQGARDGHDYIPQAIEKGASAVLCSRTVGEYPAIVVEDPRIALGRIAKGYREHLGIRVVGVTGSVGKSTTKEMIAGVLSTTYRTFKTPANYNNDIGMPMAVLSMPEDTQVAVLEMGMNHFGEIAYLSNIARPDMGVIINIGTMHIEHLGSQEGILQAKMEIISGMQLDGKLHLNGDDAFLRTVAKQQGHRTIYFGHKQADSAVMGTDVVEADGSITFTACFAGEKLSIYLPLEGQHHVIDALAAVSVGLSMGVSPENIQKGLREFQNMAGRQEIFEAKGCTIIKDCYNAGPESMAAALTVLGNRKGRRIAVLGDMLELGHRAEAEHYKVGRLCAEKADILLCYGPNGEHTVAGAVTGGLNPAYAKAFADRDTLACVLRQIANSGDVILFKGSRGMRMELALEQFLKTEE